MAFPASPTDGQIHTEGARRYQYAAAANAWALISDVASSIVVTPTGDLTSTNVQAALAELDGELAGALADITQLGSVTGNFIGQVATEAALLALTDPIDGAAPDNGDIAILTADDGSRTAGWYVRTGGAWPATPFAPIGGTVDMADAIGSDTLAGSGGVAVQAARSDHRHAQSRGATLPATTGAEGILHVLQGHGSLPDGMYTLVGTAWVQA